MTELPIDTVLSDLCRTLGKGRHAVLTAPPGAGKTSRVPLALIQQPWLAGQKILLLEPRRLAARAAASHMATLLGEPVGTTVGYRTRLDSQIGPTTRIEVVTDGILIRLLQQDPSLAAYGIVVFDEFHERSVQGDLGLTLTLETQRLFRPDLRLLVMSATLETSTVAALLNAAPILSCSGRLFPVRTHYVKEPVGFSKRAHLSFEKTVIQTITQALKEETGSLLVFLPGRQEIIRIQQRLKALSFPPDITIAPLYGDLSKEDQERAILSPPKNARKIVLATSIAETSVTIEGVRVVIDSGLMRIPRFDPRSGLTRLDTIRVTKDSADQRRGRAGRIEPGICYRLWTESQQATLTAQRTPELMEADLAPLVLETALWGTTDLSELSWLTAPPTGAVRQARTLLQQLHALDGHGRITTHGRNMANVGIHPRLAHMILSSLPFGRGKEACVMAALLTEGDPLQGTPERKGADIHLRLDLLDDARKPTEEITVDHGTLRRIARSARLLYKKTQGAKKTSSTSGLLAPSDAVGLLLAHAYPDRIAKRQPGGERSFRLANGRGACFPKPDPLAQEDYLVVADLDGGRPWATIYLAAPLVEKDLEEIFKHDIREQDTVWWDEKGQTVQARTQRLLQELVLDDRPLSAPPPDLIRKALRDGIRRLGLQCLPWTKIARQWQSRVQFVRRSEGKGSTLPDLSDAALLNEMETWLEPYLDGMTKLDQVQQLDLLPMLKSLLSWEGQHRIDRLAPTHLVVPSGSRIPLDYHSSEIPILAVRLQEMFGCRDQPTVMGGRIPVLVQLLSPAGRPVQTTQDLKGFWQSSYQDVKKEMRGRYPKHPWPDDPLQAAPTRKAKRKN